jgi:hypothetical protein
MICGKYNGTDTNSPVPEPGSSYTRTFEIPFELQIPLFPINPSILTALDLLPINTSIDF